MSKTRVFIITSVAILALAAGALYYYFYRVDAPIIKGEILYGIDYKQDQELDIYLPTQQVYDLSPVVLFLHGGAWIAGSKESINIDRFNSAINQLRERGYAVISPNYTLASRDQSPFPKCIEDAFDAYWWIISNSSDYALDINRMGVFGESAGAHIAMMLAYSDHQLFSEIDEKPNLQYVVNVYGPNNLDNMYHMQTMDSVNKLLARLPENLREHLDIARFLFGFNPKIDSLRAIDFMEVHSPAKYVSRDSPPTLMIHGAVDQIVPIDQSLTLQSILSEVGVDNELHILDSVDHAFRGATEAQKDSVQTWIVDFIESFN